MYLTSIIAIFSAARALFRNRRAFLLILATYAALLATSYLFVSTREATIPQLVLTLVVVIAAPALFFVLQSLSVSYTDGPTSRKKIVIDSLKLLLATVPVIALTLLTLDGLNQLQNHPTLATTLRYLFVAVVAPLLTIQLWIVTINDGLLSLLQSLRRVLTRSFAPPSVFAYACGFLIFAVAPYCLLQKVIPLQRPWLEFSILVFRLGLSAILILLGWVTTVGAISILNRQEPQKLGKDWRNRAIVFKS